MSGMEQQTLGQLNMGYLITSIGIMGRNDLFNPRHSHGSFQKESYQPVCKVFFELRALCGPFSHDLSGYFILYRFGSQRSGRICSGYDSGIF